MNRTFVVALIAFAVVSGGLVLVWARSSSKRRMATILQMVRELGAVVGGDSELLGIDGRTVQVRQGKMRLQIPTSRLVNVFLRFQGDQRTWQLRQLVGEALATALPMESAQVEITFPSDGNS